MSIIPTNYHNSINLRLILVSGKTKDFLFSPNDSASDISNFVFNNWPDEWQDEPTVARAEILRLIYQGRFLHGSVSLDALQLPLGRTTVMHLVPREHLPDYENSSGELALQKSFSEEMKKSQGELDDFLFELEEDVEGMQSTIYHLQQQLKESKELLQKYKLKEEEEDNQSKDNSNVDLDEKSSEQSIDKQNNELNNDDKGNDSNNDDLNINNNESNGDKSIDNQTEEEKNNLERKRSLDEVLEEVNQSGNECGIDSIIKKHRKLDQDNESILKNS